MPYYTCESSGLNCSEMKVTALNYIDSTGSKLNVGMAVGRNMHGNKSFFEISFIANKIGDIYDSINRIFGC